MRATTALDIASSMLAVGCGRQRMKQGTRRRSCDPSGNRRRRGYGASGRPRAAGRSNGGPSAPQRIRCMVVRTRENGVYVVGGQRSNDLASGSVHAATHHRRGFRMVARPLRPQFGPQPNPQKKWCAWFVVGIRCGVAHTGSVWQRVWEKKSAIGVYGCTNDPGEDIVDRDVLMFVRMGGETVHPGPRNTAVRREWHPW